MTFLKDKEKSCPKDQCVVIGSKTWEHWFLQYAYPSSKNRVRLWVLTYKKEKERKGNFLVVMS